MASLNEPQLDPSAPISTGTLHIAVGAPLLPAVLACDERAAATSDS